MRLAGIFSLVLFVGGCSADASESDRGAGSVLSGPFRGISFSEACRLAGEKHKVVLIDFFTTWCVPCKLLDETTWKDLEVVAWLGERTVPLKIDAEEEIELASRYRVDAYPTIVMLRPDGSEIDRLVGYLDPGAFLKTVRAGLSGEAAAGGAKEGAKTRLRDRIR